MSREIAKAEVLARLRVYCADRGSQLVAAAHLGISPAMLSMCLSGRKPIPARILSVIGVHVRRRIVVERTFFLSEVA